MTGRVRQRAGGGAAQPVTEKLQKVLARAGLGSRRELEQWISDGRVQVNGVRAALGDRVSPTDEVRVDGRILQGARDERVRPRVLRYHKPAGEVCTRRDPEGRPTVFEHLPGIRGRRWIAVGRLDVNTSGLLLFTDSGELAHRLMHPSSQVEREYAVRVYGSVAPDVLDRVASGVVLEDGEARFERLRDAGGEGRNHWYRVCVREGRNRLVRRLWASQGVEVSRLTRVRYAGVELPRRLRAGRWDELPAADVWALMQAAGMRTAQDAAAQRADGPGRAPSRTRSAQREAGHTGTKREPAAGTPVRGRPGTRAGARQAEGEGADDRAPARATPPARRGRGAAQRGRKPRR